MVSKGGHYRKLDCFIKIAMKYRWQFHQHFMRAFFAQKQIAQLSLVIIQLFNFWRQNFDTKKMHVKR